MIFVAVGTQKFQMNRLLRKIDDLIKDGVIVEEVFAQIGNSDYVPTHYQFEYFLDKDSFENKIAQCDLLVTHGGVSTIIAGVERQKPVIVFPRLAKYREHVDEHQLQIANSFSKMNYVCVCDDEEKLAELIDESRNHHFEKYVSQRKRMVGLIDDYLGAL